MTKSSNVLEHVYSALRVDQSGRKHGGVAAESDAVESDAAATVACTNSIEVHGAKGKEPGLQVWQLRRARSRGSVGGTVDIR